MRRQTNVEIGTSSQIHRQWRGWRSLACSRNNCDRKKSRGSNKTLAALMIPIKHLSDSFFGNLLTSAVIGTGAGAGVDSAWEQEKLQARKMLENAAESPASSAPEKMSGPSFYTRETGVQLTTAKVYSERASTQAVQSNGERVKRFP